MQLGAMILLASAVWPMTIAWRATAKTTLRSSVAWAALAAAMWLLALATEVDVVAYLALSLSGCAGIAVLGARRPGVGAWNFVVAGLLAVLLLPVAQGWGTPRVEVAHVIFIGATLMVPVLNYLPTRLGLAVLLCSLGCTTELCLQTGTTIPRELEYVGRFCLGAGPWVGLLMRRRGSAAAPFDRIWLEYRDRFGFVWGQRSREQFNRAAENSGWTVWLTWHELERRPSGLVPGEDELIQTLRAVLKRFGPA